MSVNHHCRLRPLRQQHQLTQKVWVCGDVRFVSMVLTLSLGLDYNMHTYWPIARHNALLRRLWLAACRPPCYAAFDWLVRYQCALHVSLQYLDSFSLLIACVSVCNWSCTNALLLVVVLTCCYGYCYFFIITVQLLLLFVQLLYLHILHIGEFFNKFLSHSLVIYLIFMRMFAFVEAFFK